MWDARTITHLIKQQYGIELGKQTVREYLERWGFLMKHPQKRAYYQNQKDKVFLILDNLKVHQGKLVQQYLINNADEIAVFYFPSYSPEMNPDEYLNNILKCNIHNGLPPKNKKEIYDKMYSFLTNLKGEQIQKLF